jgi:hypothetical protein
LNTSESYHIYKKIVTIDILDCFLLVNYIFLDIDERIKFSQSKHEYLIEQLTYIGNKSVESVHRSLKINFDHPCTFIVWICQQQYLCNTYNNDLTNFTDSHQIINNKYIGKNIVSSASLLLNGQERVSLRDGTYFNWIQPYQHFKYTPNEGINVYSFSLLPTNYQPSGSCNMSKIDSIILQFTMKPILNFNHIINVRMYAITYNMLRIVYGLCGTAFSN